MSKRTILAALKKKNIPVIDVSYERGCPTPYGYADGWSITISDETEDALYLNGFSNCSCYNEFDTLAEVLEWVDEMPMLNLKEGSDE